MIRSGIGYPSDIQDSLASGARPDDLDEAAAILDQIVAQTNRGGSNADESNQARSGSWRRAEPSVPIIPSQSPEPTSSQAIDVVGSGPTPGAGKNPLWGRG